MANIQLFVYTYITLIVFFMCNKEYVIHFYSHSFSKSATIMAKIQLVSVISKGRLCGWQLKRVVVKLAWIGVVDWSHQYS